MSLLTTNSRRTLWTSTTGASPVTVGFEDQAAFGDFEDNYDPIPILVPDGAIGQGELGDPIALESNGAPDVLGQHRVHSAGIDEKTNRDRPPALTRATHLARHVRQRHRQGS